MLRCAPPHLEQRVDLLRVVHRDAPDDEQDHERRHARGDARLADEPSKHLQLVLQRRVIRLLLDERHRLPPLGLGADRRHQEKARALRDL